MSNTSSSAPADALRNEVAATHTPIKAVTSMLRNERFIAVLGIVTWLIAIAWIIHSLQLGVSRHTIIIWPAISMLWSLMWWCKGK